MAVVLERDHAGQREAGKVAYRSGETDAHQLDALLAATPRIGLWLDTSTQTPVEARETTGLPTWVDAFHAIHHQLAGTHFSVGRSINLRRPWSSRPPSLASGRRTRERSSRRTTAMRPVQPTLIR
jgi:hypothetical protein